MGKIIAFAGAKESGKSTSAELFKSLVSGPTKEIAFAGHLKNVCSTVFGLEMKFFLDTVLKEAELDSYIHLTSETVKQVFELFEISEYTHDEHVRKHMGQVFDTPRKLLQYVGTEVLHPIDPLIHVNFAMKKIDPDVTTLITDLRFPVEFDAMYGKDNFIPVYVSNLKAELAAEADSHASEKGWQKFKDRCYQLDNNGTIGELTNNLKTLIEEKVT